MRTFAILLTLLFSATSLAQVKGDTSKAEPKGPMYKPSSSSKKALDISKNAYGAYAFAPKAPKIGDSIEDFKRPSVAGTFDLEKARQKGPVVLIFYRGDW